LRRFNSIRDTIATREASLVKHRTWSYRFAEEILNSRLDLKKEIIDVVDSSILPFDQLTRPNLNKEFEKRFLEHGWDTQPHVGGDEIDPRLDFMKGRVGVEVAFSHASFIGIDLLKFQIMSYSSLDRIDVGVYIVATSDFIRKMEKEHNQKWEGSLPFEKVKNYLPNVRSAIQVPVYLIGLEV